MNTCKECNNTPPQFTEKVLEIINPEQPVLFHRVNFPASLGDDTQVLPDTLNYKNVLLYYEANNHAYLYSSDGVPTLISMGEINVEEIQAKLAELGVEIDTINTNLTNLEQSTTDKFTEVEQEITELQSGAEETQATLASQAQTLENYGETDVVKNVTVSTTDASTVTMRVRTGFIKGVEDDYISGKPFPVASETQAGVMNAATFSAVQANSQNIDSILGGAVALENLPAEPTQEALTNAWQTATGQTQLINRASIMDITNQKMWYFYTNVNEWYSVNNIPEVSVSIATNDTPGIVQGSEEPGEIYVNPGGKMSLNGWDGVQHDVENIVQLLEGTPIPKLYTAYSTATDGANTANFINKLLNTNTIYLGFGSTYITASQANGGIAIGRYSKADGSSIDSDFTSIAIGAKAEATSRGIAIGSKAGATDSSVVIGDHYSSSAVNRQSGVVAIGAQTLCASGATAIGTHAKANTYTAGTNTSFAVAIGNYSSTTRSNEVSFGKGNASGSGIATRFLANVTAGELPTDGVNKQQLDDSKNRAWQPNTAYTAGELITNDGTLYSVTEAFTSGEEFDDTTLESIGGGSGDEVKLYNEWGTNIDGALTQNFLNTRMKGGAVALGTGATVWPSEGSMTAGSVAIGYNAKASGAEDAIAIGNQANAQYGGVAIGYNSQLASYTVAIGSRTRTANYGVALGSDAKNSTSSTTNQYSVALGYAALNSRSSEVSIGNASATDSAQQTRYLANLRAGELPTDAVNLAQMQEYVAEHGGGGESQLTNDDVTKVKNLGVGSLTNMDGVAQTETEAQIEFTRQNLTTGVSETQTATIAGATSEEAGVMSAADKTKLDTVPELTEMQWTRTSNLPPAVVTGFEDTSYGTDTITMHLDTKDLATGGVSVQELELTAATPNTDEAGGQAGLMSAFQATQLQTLAESGGGGKLYSEYGTNTDGGLTQAFVSEQLNGTGIALGTNAGKQGSFYDSALRIGLNTYLDSTSQFAGSPVLLGANARTAGATSATQQGSYNGVAIGAASHVSYNGVAIGYSAIANQSHSVALGDGSRADRSNAVSIGYGTGATTYPATRLLTNVSAAQMGTDATNLAQVRSATVGDVLYASAEPSSTITLSSSVAAYEKVEIIGSWVMPHNPASTPLQLTTHWHLNDQDNSRTFQLRAMDVDTENMEKTEVVDTWTITNSTTIDLLSNAQISGSLTDPTIEHSTTPYITITKVIGIKAV